MTVALSAWHGDTVVVGAGSAGSVVAAELSRDPSRSVLVVEAGTGRSDPALAARAADGSHLPIGADSPLVSRYPAELTGRPGSTAQLVRGSTVGGSGAVNGGYFCRALPHDIDGYPAGWDWPTVLEHFRAIETDLDFAGPQHGDRGPIPVRRTGEMCSGTDRFVRGAQRAGFGWIADLNDAGAGAGVGAVPLNIVDGVRTGPGAAYLLPALSRPNLTLLTGVRAQRVQIAASRAIGVTAVGPDGPLQLAADRIVLCAGAIETAHLLMLSGIGEPAMLRAVGIDVVAGLPVGAYCADHPEWLLPADWPGSPGRPVLEAVLHTDDGLELRPYTTGFAAMMGAAVRDAPQIGVALMRPRARGRLTLMSADPAVPPRIEQRYDSEPADLADLRRGVELAAEVVGSTVQAAQPIWSTSQHLCGSAPIGADGDDRAVLDGRCRVRGVDGLWVVDGSALPGVPSRGPHASITMLAHRAVEFLNP
ncbi:mycofactocin system GMC family oxidoreductase MftG [Mycobacterium sp. M1]|uniref:Mycofactocin system GMC family oxidoreductase MftG n=1 Tax=Mycolicibacter acidiphilus TaxID=2835306 RepID=A0ABS5RLN4_9MYCO|nr:mycofactocin system GMC family oxidoreductase MftG [Mycolicibacter acidiphilus]MBS9534912.1 mycofactocin system GMC family oxidoreductase MftG [Mycolicibacter acidiphilus]